MLCLVSGEHNFMSLHGRTVLRDIARCVWDNGREFKNPKQET